MPILRLVILLTFFALLFLTQRFWFMNAWQTIADIARPRLRTTLQVAWAFALIAFVVVFFDPLLGHILSKVGGGKWIIAAVRLWLVASIFAYLGIQLVR